MPFLRVAEALKIPWLIFSDAEPDVKASVKDQFSRCGTRKSENEAIIFLSDGNNLEKQLIHDGFVEEIREAIVKIEISKCYNQKHVEAKKREIANFTESQIIEIMCMHKSKTKLAPLIAEAIIESGKPLPPKIKDLFEKLQSLLSRSNTNE